MAISSHHQQRPYATLVLKQPIGVCAAITWNFPAAMITRKVARSRWLQHNCQTCRRNTPLDRTGARGTGGTCRLTCRLSANRHRQVIVIGEVLTKMNASINYPLLVPPKLVVLMSQCASTVKKLSMELGGNAHLSSLMMPT